MNGTWTRTEIADKNADVYTPPGGRPRLGVLFLHDQDGDTLQNRPAFTSLFDSLNLGCVCPHGGRSWWADRLCPEFDSVLSASGYVRESVLPFFGENLGLSPRAVGLLGIGMGGQGALRLSFQHPKLFPVVAAIAPSIEYDQLYGRGLPIDEMYDSKEQCRQDTALLHVHPAHYPPYIFFCANPKDPVWYRGSDRLHEKLGALGIPHTCDLTTRTESGYADSQAGPALRFLTAGLEQEGRRLL